MLGDPWPARARAGGIPPSGAARSPGSARPSPARCGCWGHLEHPDRILKLCEPLDAVLLLRDARLGSLTSTSTCSTSSGGLGENALNIVPGSRRNPLMWFVLSLGGSV